MLAPEKGKSSLGIEPIRQVIETLYAHAQQGGAKVIWLPQAEQLTEAAANALLKTLEEPPEKTYFLLGCREPSRLMATLRSRCLYWHLASPDEQLSLQWLGRQAAGSQTDRLTALRLHDAPLAAEQLLQPQQWQQRSTLCAALSAALPQRDMLSLLPVLNHEDVAERLHWLLRAAGGRDEVAAGRASVCIESGSAAAGASAGQPAEQRLAAADRAAVAELPPSAAQRGGRQS